jgi:UPF0755 protein
MSKNKTKRKIKVKAILVGILLVLVLALGGGVFFVHSSLQPVSRQSDLVTFEVRSGDTIRSVVGRLADEDIIRNEFIVHNYARFRNLSNVRAGHFIIDRNWDARTILEVLNDPAAGSMPGVRITFPEGIWAREFAMRIEEVTNVTADELITLWNDIDFIKELIDIFPFITDELLVDGLHVRL